MATGLIVVVVIVIIIVVVFVHPFIHSSIHEFVGCLLLFFFVSSIWGDILIGQVS